MEKKKIKLIALDLDGTLLNEKREISEINYKAIKRAEGLGVHIVLTTGRTRPRSEEYLMALKLTSYMITVNGSEIWDEEGNLLERTLLPNKYMKELVEIAQHHSLSYKAISTNKMWLSETPENLEEHEWMTMLMDVRDNRLRKSITDSLQSNQEIEISNSSPTNIEVNAMGVTKARAIGEICGKLNISMDDVMAIGDSLNDLAMIQAAGIGVAMGNAQDEVKEAADWVAGTNIEDGVAQAIDKWILSR
ncbi:MAG: Cof-type HAD-IIB family hydrolase [Bacillus sp. (in: firmicutes)]